MNIGWTLLCGEVNLLLNATELVKTIQKIAVEAVKASNPVHICYGEVVSINPLSIAVDQKMILGSKQLVLTRNVTDYDTEVTVDWNTETMKVTHGHAISGQNDYSGEPVHSHLWNGILTSTTTSHEHKIIGRKKIRIHNALKVGNKVILLGQQGGQRYIVLDMIGEMS